MSDELLEKEPENENEPEENEEETHKEEKDSFVLTILDRFAPMYRLAGAEYEQVRFIVSTKMKMDARQENPIDTAMNSGKKKKKEKNSFFSSLWIYAFISFFMSAMLMYDNYVFQFTAFFSYLFIMMLAILVAHFSNVLLDPKDQEQIGTKPVSAKTLGAAKATHIGIYLIAFSIALGGPMIGMSMIFDGILIGVLTLFLTLLAAIWCLFITILVYAFILRHFNGEKLKNIISYSQIGISVFMIIGYHIMGDFMRVVDPETLALELNMQWWHIFVFPLWFVSPYGLVEEGYSHAFLGYLGLLIVGTVALLFLYRAYSDKIDRNLQKMNTDGTQGTKPSRLSHLYAKVFCRGREKIYFDFAWQLTKKEREFKTRLYPSIASALLIPFILLWSTMSMEATPDALPEIFGFAPYFVTMMIPMTSVTIRYSNNYRARWVFQISPEKEEGVLLRGIFKAMYTKLLLPVYVATSLIILFMLGISTLPTLMNGLLLIGLIFYADLSFTMNAIPFTKRYDASEANRGCIASLIFFIATAVVAGILILIQMLLPFGVYVIMLPLLAATIWVFTKGFQKKKFQTLAV